MDRQFHVYILASRPRGALYVGRTVNLVKRIWEHREGVVDGHTKRYRIKQLVYFETTGSLECAYAREKQLKRYRREWKFNLIEQGNPGWKDLWFEIDADISPYLTRPISTDAPGSQ
ncbi:MAG: hypothetical protein CMF74_10070 [Maricaulis sp.]|jgi:putative endonuclease|nr:hypothetical protein [Maricaulis sp.]